MDMIHSSRKIEPSISQWYDVLDTALEHASHAWYALEQTGTVERTNSGWPPNVANKVGSAPYHFASMITYIHEVFNSISDAHDSGLFDNVPVQMPIATSLIRRNLARAGNFLIKLSEWIG